MNKASKVIFSSIIAVIFLISYPAKALAIFSFFLSWFNSPSVKEDLEGKIGSSPKGAGGRGNCPNLAQDKQLIALIPAYTPETQESSKAVLSYTIKQRPNLWFYIPYKYDEKTQVKFAKLALIDEEKHLISQPPFLFQLPQQPGIVQVNLPINLEVNKPYKWFLSIVCDENKPSRNPSVSGWIQRILPNKAGFIVEPSEDVLARISYRDMAKNGLWFDAFTRLAEVYQSTNPHSYIQSSVKSENFTKSLDSEIQEDWLAVFKGLELGDDKITSEISKSPIFKLDCVSRTDGRKCE